MNDDHCRILFSTKYSLVFVKDTYGTYAELRHKAELVMQEGGPKAADIEAQRDFMDMVCRSYAARLDRRRNLLITSVRFHRLAEEVCPWQCSHVKTKGNRFS